MRTVFRWLNLLFSTSNEQEIGFCKKKGKVRTMKYSEIVKETTSQNIKTRF